LEYIFVELFLNLKERMHPENRLIEPYRPKFEQQPIAIGVPNIKKHDLPV